MEMNKHFCTYEQSLALRQFGFDEECFGYWNMDYQLNKPYLNPRCQPFKHEWCLPAPLKSQAFEFFREKFNTLAVVYSNASGYLFQWQDYIGGTHRGWSDYKGPNDAGVWETYEEAENACIDKLIEIVKNNQYE